MKPIVNRGDLTELPEKQQKKICQCKQRCKHFITLTTFADGTILCGNDALEYAYDILFEMDVVSQKKAFPKSDYGWTTEQEVMLKKYINDNGVKYGTYSLLAEMLGKTRNQVKNKIYHMREEGKL